MSKRPLGIYIHIPFCVRKCLYCDFLSAPAGQEIRERYVDELIREIRQYGTLQSGRSSLDAGCAEWTGPTAYEAVSIFIGGGTPSLLSGAQIARILEAVSRRFTVCSDAEITMECNPGTMEDLPAAGINRLSLGLQSADDEELRRLGRIHTWADFLDSYDSARKAGFENINIDLMSGIPGQTAASWERTLEQVLALKPEHVSAYSLIIEEGTPFGERYGADRSGLPDEDEELVIDRLTRERLEAAGLQRYEISNYARPGFESRHNTGYWVRREYIGFGLGASSQTGTRRCRNTDRLERYLAGDHEPCEVTELTRKDEIEETMFLGLRMIRGISSCAFAQRFGRSLQSVYPEVLPRLLEQGLVEWYLRSDAGVPWLRLTRRGLEVSNPVLAEFLL